MCLLMWYNIRFKIAFRSWNTFAWFLRHYSFLFISTLVKPPTILINQVHFIYRFKRIEEWNLDFVDPDFRILESFANFPEIPVHVEKLLGVRVDLPNKTNQTCKNELTTCKNEFWTCKNEFWACKKEFWNL